MGSRDAEAYLASPAVVAASAAAGFITGPEDLGSSVPEYAFTDLGWTPPVREVAILDGFPETISGRALLFPVDSLNTDGIYGKDVTYIDDLTPDQMAGHAMANYDPDFQNIATDGDVIVAGRNVGTGSSREQAATALKYRGIQAVIAGSFSQTYLRNAFNNAFICLESPALSDAVRAAHDAEADAGVKTIPAGDLEVDFKRAVTTWNGAEYRFSPVGPAAQELVLAGGLEALTRKRIKA
jgi:homoaconitate hydratase